MGDATRSLGGESERSNDITSPATPAAPRGAPSDARPPTSDIPARLGRYTITRVLGQGGMGTVYEAEQESPRRTVALKVIRAGYLAPEMLRRFELESQVLGRLQHPGIAQIYEAGVLANPEHQRRAAPIPDDASGPSSAQPPGTPFFAMEFVRGVPLTEYADSRRLGTRQRLELLAKVCDAVYHAHQKGVIHRDLKPSNILVTELDPPSGRSTQHPSASAQPKILDFGVARATDSDIQQTTMQTDVGQLIGTVPYMSPEQVTGDPKELDTRSDVYALGVIAYELLAGRLPYDLQRKMIHEAARIIREEEPTRLSSINRTLRGDVETIVAKALEKEKTRRYQSAESLASDIRRYLNDEPIAARPASTWYQAAKFAQRNRGLVTGLAAAFVLLIAGVIGTSIGLRQAVLARDAEVAARKEADAQRDAAVAARAEEVKQRALAESQRDKAEKIAEFMSDTLAGVGPSVARGRDITMLKEMMDAAAARIEQGDLKDAPEAELRLRGTIGSTYRQLALYPESASMLEAAAALARSLHPGDHPDTADTLNDLAMLLQVRGDLEGAQKYFRESLDMVRRLRPDLRAGGSMAVAACLNNLASVLRARGDLAGAGPLMRESLDIRRRLAPGDDPALARGLNSLANLLHDLGDLDGAEAYYRESLDMRRRLYAGDHPDVAVAVNNMAELLNDRGDVAGAEPLYREAIDMFRRVHHADHPFVANGLNNLANLLRGRGDLDAAEARYRESLEIRRRLFPGDHAAVAQSLNNLGLLLMHRADLANAESLLREALDMKRRLFAGEHPEVAIGLNSLALVLKARGDLAAAEPLVREAFEMRRAALGERHPHTLISLYHLADVLTRMERHADAAPLVEACIERGAATYGADHRRTLDAIRLSVNLYESWDKADPGKGHDATAAEWKARLDAIAPREAAAPADPG